MIPFVKHALEVAGEEVGVREERGPNWGPRVQEYLAATEIRFPAPWCAAFVRWCMLRAAERTGTDAADVPALSGISPRNFAYCPNLAAWASTEGVLESSPEPGDLFLYYGNGRARHVGFVVDKSSTHFRTIEGNTNLGGSPEGIGVFRRTRARGPAYRFVRYGDLIQDTSAQPYQLFLNNRLLFPMPVQEGRALAPVRAWGNALGFEVAWDAQKQAVLFDGQELDAEVTLIEGVGHAPIRDLVRSAGLRLTVDVAARRVDVGR